MASRRSFLKGIAALGGLVLAGPLCLLEDKPGLVTAPGPVVVPASGYQINALMEAAQRGWISRHQAVALGLGHAAADRLMTQLAYDYLTAVANMPPVGRDEPWRRPITFRRMDVLA